MGVRGPVKGFGRSPRAGEAALAARPCLRRGALFPVGGAEPSAGEAERVRHFVSYSNKIGGR